MKNNEIDDLTHDIIGCAMEVHKAIGSGFPKEIYLTCLAREFTMARLEFVQGQEMVVYYKDQAVGTMFVDFIVEGNVLVEVKTVEKLEDKHRIHTINHCKLFNITDGLLLNFGSQPLDCKRVYSRN
ncbi:MAG: GxxExxY protein [Bacteroidetes bacterium]|nr:GxxExxY protein [Bacteroidota bacterium]